MTTLLTDELIDRVSSKGGAWGFSRPIGGIGDGVMCLPAATALKDEIGDELLIMSCVDYIAPVFYRHPAFDYVLAYTQDQISEGLNYKDLDVLEKLGSVVVRLYDPDPAVIYENTHFPIRKSRQEIFCEEAGVRFNIDNYLLDIPEEHEDIPSTFGLGDRYIVVQLRTHDKWRDYSRMKWLLPELYRWGCKHDIQIATIDSVYSANVKGVFSFSQMHLSQIMAIVKRSMLFVGADSMGVHLKGAFGGPVLGLFGPTDPAVRLKYHNAYWMPRFKRCKRQYCWYRPCLPKLCMRSLQTIPRKIIRKIEHILQEAVY